MRFEVEYKPYAHVKVEGKGLMIKFIHYISTPNLEHAWNYTQVRIASEIFEARKD